MRFSREKSDGLCISGKASISRERWALALRYHIRRERRERELPRPAIEIDQNRRLAANEASANGGRKEAAGQG